MVNEKKRRKKADVLHFTFKAQLPFDTIIYYKYNSVDCICNETLR